MSSRWRRKEFFHQDSEGKDHYQGTCEVILELEKKVSWAGNIYMPCSCVFKLHFDKNKSLFSFSGVVEGRNKVNAFRF
jgi:hypothetical protein